MLKLICKAVAGFALFGAAAILAAQTIPHFDYIVIIFQENRTPDNLFGVTPAVSCNQEDPFELGVDIVDGGCRQGSGNNGSCPANDVPICNIPLPLDTNAVLDNNRHSVDPPHSHKSTWVPDYDNGNMDGFIQEQGKDQKGNPIFYQYSYVNKSDVQAYYDISTAYGFANYMFQTNQGPSFEAHQFIFGGTSAPLDITVNQMCNSTPATSGSPPSSNPATPRATAAAHRTTATTSFSKTSVPTTLKPIPISPTTAAIRPRMPAIHATIIKPLPTSCRSQVTAAQLGNTTLPASKTSGTRPALSTASAATWETGRARTSRDPTESTTRT